MREYVCDCPACDDPSEGDQCLLGFCSTCWDELNNSEARWGLLCDRCAAEAGQMKTQCMRCGWFGVPISPEGMAPSMCNVCEYLHPNWEEES